MLICSCQQILKAINIAKNKKNEKINWGVCFMRTALEKLLTFSLKVISNLKTLSVWVFQ